MSEPDEQEMAELFDEDALGEDGVLIDELLRADDIDMVESVADRASHEEADFDRRPGRGDMVHGLLGAPEAGGSDRTAELVATEYPAEGPLSPEEAALHFEDH